MTTITATLETNGVSQQLRQNTAGILFLASAKPDWVTITGYKTVLDNSDCRNYVRYRQEQRASFGDVGRSERSYFVVRERDSRRNSRSNDGMAW